MKTIFHYLPAVLMAAPILFACSGNIDGESGEGEGSTGAFKISVDKTVIEADGKDAATVTVTDDKGNNFSAAEISRIYIVNAETGEKLGRGVTTFTSIDNGTFTLKVSYRGEESQNTVQVTAQNRGKYETFHRNIAFYKLTGFQCPNCPEMTAGLNGLDENHKAHIVILACHANIPKSDPFVIEFGNSASLGEYLLYGFGGSGVPAAIYDLNVFSDQQRSSYEISAQMDELRIEYPATCGIKVKSAYSDGKITVNATLKSSTGGDYDLGYAILEDGLIKEGGVSVNNQYDHVVRAVSSNFRTYDRATAKTVEKDGEQSWNFTVTDGTFGNMENVKVAVFALVKSEGGDTRVDNIVECPLGEEVDYVYNK